MGEEFLMRLKNYCREDMGISELDKQNVSMLTVNTVNKLHLLCETGDINPPFIGLFQELNESTW